MFTETINIILSHLTAGGCWLIFCPTFKSHTGVSDLCCASEQYSNPLVFDLISISLYHQYTRGVAGQKVDANWIWTFWLDICSLLYSTSSGTSNKSDYLSWLSLLSAWVIAIKEGHNYWLFFDLMLENVENLMSCRFVTIFRWVEKAPTSKDSLHYYSDTKTCDGSSLCSSRGND